MKRVTSLLALIIITNLPTSCGLGCGPFDNYELKIVTISSTVGSIFENTFSESISTNFDAAVIRAVVDETHRVGQTTENFIGLSNLAYACSPPEPGFQRLRAIRIISSESVFVNGNEYKAGDDLGVIFIVIDFNSEVGVQNFNNNPDSIYLFPGYEGMEIMFQLRSKPDLPIDQKFTLTFTFDDALEYQVLTPTFTVE